MTQLSLTLFQGAKREAYRLRNPLLIEIGVSIKGSASMPLLGIGYDTFPTAKLAIFFQSTMLLLAVFLNDKA